jgi:hypothetical protein
MPAAWHGLRAALYRQPSCGHWAAIDAWKYHRAQAMALHAADRAYGDFTGALAETASALSAANREAQPSFRPTPSSFSEASRSSRCISVCNLAEISAKTNDLQIGQLLISQGISYTVNQPPQHKEKDNLTTLRNNQTQVYSNAQKLRAQVDALAVNSPSGRKRTTQRCGTGESTQVAWHHY